jgi:hypothetical protein
VLGPEARPLDGVSRIGPEECSCSFVPRLAWTAGPHRLIVDPVLEDLAGNSLTRVFDRDLSGRTEEAFGPVFVGSGVRAPLRAGRLAVVRLRNIPSGWYSSLDLSRTSGPNRDEGSGDRKTLGAAKAYKPSSHTEGYRRVHAQPNW